MTEQERLKSQPEVEKMLRRASRIIRSAWIAFLSTLLAVSLFFQAPWKVITLVFVFLFAATVLPRAYRKWFWAAVGCAAVAVAIWVFLPEETEGWRPYTFDSELAALRAKYAIPDEGNAATIYNQLLEDYNEAAFRPDFTYSNLTHFIRKEQWSGRYYPEITQWLGQQEGTIAN